MFAIGGWIEGNLMADGTLCCLQKIPGRQDAAISSLVWCRSEDEDAAPLGRLFSAGLDGFVIEWDLLALQPKVRSVLD